MKPKKVPLRKCVVTQERLPKGELVRVVKTKDGEVFADPSGKTNGRGAYLTLKTSVIKKAQDKKILNKVLETEVPDTVFEELMKLAKDS